MLDFNSLKNISFKFCFTKYLYLLLFLFCLIKLQFQTRAVENMFLKFVILFFNYFRSKRTVCTCFLLLKGAVDILRLR